MMPWILQNKSASYSSIQGIHTRSIKSCLLKHSPTHATSTEEHIKQFLSAHLISERACSPITSHSKPWWSHPCVTVFWVRSVSVVCCSFLRICEYIRELCGWSFWVGMCLTRQYLECFGNHCKSRWVLTGHLKRSIRPTFESLISLGCAILIGV